MADLGFSAKRIVSVLILAAMAFGVSVSAFINAAAEDSVAGMVCLGNQSRPASTTGPTPTAAQLDTTYTSAQLDYQVVIPNVPAYLWHHGCGPTAAGMVIGYWDYIGFDELVAGDASSQRDNPDVNEMIAGQEHYEDYSSPLDTFRQILPDKSELGGAHSDNCLGDWMRTSWSIDMMPYGWSYFDMVDDAFTGYTNWLAAGYVPQTEEIFWGGVMWPSFCEEIDAGHPVVFLVDSNKDGWTDHFVPAFGYGEVQGVRMYACYTTWDTKTHWYEFGPMTTKTPFGIYGAILFSLGHLGSSPPAADFTVTPEHAIVGWEVELDASMSWDAESPDELTFRWDWEGDGTWDTQWTPDKTATHIYQSPGAYAVKLEVKDAAGQTDVDYARLLVSSANSEERTTSVTVVKTPGVNSGPVTWRFTPIFDGYCFAWIESYGFKSLVLEVYDLTLGAKVFHWNVKFGTYDGFPSGFAVSDWLWMVDGHEYKIVAQDFEGRPGSMANIHTVQF